jgi:hypothetical protein
LPKTYAPVWIEVLKRKMLKFLEMTEAEESIPRLRANIPLSANAYLQPTEFGMVDGEILPQIANPTTMRAVWISKNVLSRFFHRNLLRVTCYVSR